MAVKSEEIQLRIVASGNAAKKELADLAQTQEDLKRKIDGLDKKSKDYAATKRKLTAELQQTNERMRKLRSEMDLNSMSMRDLRNRANDLKRVMDNMKPNTPEWNRLNGQLQQTNARMRELRGTTQQMGSTWGSMMNAVKGGVMAYAGIQGVQALWNGAKDAIAAYTKQAQAVAKVNQAITSTSGAAGLSLSQLQQEASALQKKTLFGDETILNDATAQLLTFTNIAGDNFLRTQRVALDLSTVLDGDLKSASIQLGKALNDPVANLSALSRSGIQFSTAQKAVIKELAETNRLAEAQKVILDELERQYGGQAETAAKVGGGWVQLGNVLGDLMEEIGGFITALFNTESATASLIGVVGNMGATVRSWAEGVLQARQWMRDWYDDSVVLRGAVQLLSAGVKTNILFLVQFLDMAIVKPIQGIIAGIKATRLVMEGEFKQAGAVLKDHFNAVVDDWKQFGSEYKGIWSDAIDEVRNPQPWKELDTNSAKALNNLKENAKAAVAQAKADIEALKKIVAEGDGNGLPERGGNTTSSFDQEAMQKQIEDKAYLTQQLWELARTSEELELEAANAYYNELAELAKKYGGDSVLIEKKRQEDIANIKKKFAQNNVKAEEITLQQGLNNLSGALDQVEGLLGENAAAMQSFGLFKLAIDTATSISSAIAGATQAAAATGPGAPFTIAAYIASMVATVVGAFVKAKKLITGADAPKFAKGGVLSGPRHAMGGMAVVDQYGNKQAEVEGGEAILPVETTNANMPFIQYMLANPGKTVMPTPSVNIDTSSLNTSVSGAPRFANGGTMPTAPNYVTTSSAADNSAVVATLEKLTAAVLMDKDRRAVVSIQQFTDKQEDLDTIKKFSDIRST